MHLLCSILHHVVILYHSEDIHYEQSKILRYFVAPILNLDTYKFSTLSFQQCIFHSLLFLLSHFNFLNNILIGLVY